MVFVPGAAADADAADVIMESAVEIKISSIDVGGVLFDFGRGLSKFIKDRPRFSP